MAKAYVDRSAYVFKASCTCMLLLIEKIVSVERIRSLLTKVDTFTDVLAVLVHISYRLDAFCGLEWYVSDDLKCLTSIFLPICGSDPFHPRGRACRCAQI